MRSRKILVAMVAGLLLVSLIAPAVAVRGNCNPTGPKECTLEDLLEWLIAYFQWLITGRPDGPPPVPWWCIV
ncbi:MAG: hypothetical protein HXS48_11685 [Theionarchaea archaeon]|nr:hypothetical protein [Theionarchaea archaeon]